MRLRMENEHRQQIQRLTLGLDTRNEAQNQQLQQLKQRLEDHTKRLTEQEQQIEQTEQMKTPKKSLAPLLGEVL